MKLPQLPYAIKKIDRQIIAFGGINMTQMTREGELAGGYGLSSKDYPYISSCENRTPKADYEGVSDIFTWDNKLFAVMNGMLYCDDKPLCNITDGKKQFAVVNTKICIWPDKIYYDWKTERVGNLENSVTGAAISQITDDSITLSPTEKITDFKAYPVAGQTATGTYTYGSDISALLDCYSDGAWDQDALALLQAAKTVDNVPSYTYMSIGDIVVLKEQDGVFSIVSADLATDTPDVSQYSSAGYFGINKINTASLHYAWFDVYKINLADTLSTMFSQGSSITLENTLYKLVDAENVVISSVDDDTNTLSFPADTFRAPVRACAIPTRIVTGQLCKFRYPYNSTYRSCYFTAQRDHEAGTIFWRSTTDISAPIRLYVWDEDAQREVMTYICSDGPQGDHIDSDYTQFDAEVYAPITEETVVKKPFPKLDYICSWENRLWGVSNEDRTIYASALGDPSQFYTFEGADTDSYAVAVGSEGNFTGIIGLGGVCCFKEKTLHKILGSVPSQFYMGEYGIDGVQEGAYKTMCIVNEILYYKGIKGVYMFTGSAPALISAALGEDLHAVDTDCLAAGSDGNRYYIGGVEVGGSTKRLMVYDIARRMWLREVDREIIAFTYCDNTLYILDKSGEIYEPADSGPVQWKARFTPFYEGAIRKKGYTKLDLRLEVSGVLLVSIKEDTNIIRPIYSSTDEHKRTIVIPIRLKRCDRCILMVQGVGAVKLLSMTRTFLQGSDV